MMQEYEAIFYNQHGDHTADRLITAESLADAMRFAAGEIEKISSRHKITEVAVEELLGKAEKK